MEIGEVRPAWILIRKDEGHVFVEGVWEKEEECLKYLKKTIPESFRSLYSNYNLVINFFEDGNTYDLVIKDKDGTLRDFYEYVIIKGKINLGFHDPNWKRN